MRADEYLQCINFGLLIKDKIHNQTIPIVLAIDEAAKGRIEEANHQQEVKDEKMLLNGDLAGPEGDNVASKKTKTKKGVTLTYGGQAVALLEDYEIFPHRKEERAAAVFKTTNPGHPSIRMILDSGDWLIGGDLRVLVRKVVWGDGLDAYRLKPSEIRARLKAMQVGKKEIFKKISNFNSFFSFPLLGGRRLRLSAAQPHPQRPRPADDRHEAAAAGPRLQETGAAPPPAGRLDQGRRRPAGRPHPPAPGRPRGGRP